LNNLFAQFYKVLQDVAHELEFADVPEIS